MRKPKADIALIGGTGIYDPDIIENAEKVKIHTLYGSPSATVTLGDFGETKIAFIPRHGDGHILPPHKIPYQANVWALMKLGVKRIIASSAVGSLRMDFEPGHFVLTDQFIDRTKKRSDTFYEGGQICHISSADPLCPELRKIFGDYADKLGLVNHKEGTYVCIEGPRFSTRAESNMFKQWGCDIIGMTMYPEVILAREAQICYVSVAMVTDYDVWAEKPVSATEVMETMELNSENFKRLIMGTIPEIPEDRNCECETVLTGALY